jgi:PhnB protein
MGSDSCSVFGPPPTAGNNFSISFSAESREQADQVFGKLSDGGAATFPMQDMFWGSYFGSLTDKFGINWQVSHHPEEH